MLHDKTRFLSFTSLLRNGSGAPEQITIPDYEGNRVERRKGVFVFGHEIDEVGQRAHSFNVRSDASASAIALHEIRIEFSLHTPPRRQYIHGGPKQ